MGRRLAEATNARWTLRTRADGGFLLRLFFFLFLLLALVADFVAVFAPFVAFFLLVEEFVSAAGEELLEV